MVDRRLGDGGGDGSAPGVRAGASAWPRGLRIDCSCFGSGGTLAVGEDPGYGWELARDGGLFLLAALLARWPAGHWSLDGRLAGTPKASP